MNYLRDNRLAAGRKKKRTNTFIFVVLFILIIVYFRQSIFNTFSTAFQGFGLPIWQASNTANDNLSFLFDTKQSLLAENQNLKDELSAGIALSADRQVLFEENLQLKEIL